ncbi:MAG: hypothetical protein RL684_536 [Pseudomonadota bacterium]
MCLIAIAWRVDARYPVVLAANRDEFHARPTAPMHWWQGEPPLLAGRDLQAGGTWLGALRGGRFAALTNYRDPALQRDDAPSRGLLVPALLREPAPLAQALEAAVLAARGANPYNLLAGEGDSLLYYSSMTGRSQSLGPGLHLLSNHLLGTPWPKLRRVQAGMPAAVRALPAVQELKSLFTDATLAPDGQLPRTGVRLELERMLSAIHIRSPAYGTRCTTVGLCDAGGRWQWHEWRYGADGESAGQGEFGYSPQGPT